MPHGTASQAQLGPRQIAPTGQASSGGSSSSSSRFGGASLLIGKPGATTMDDVCIPLDKGVGRNSPCGSSAGIKAGASPRKDTVQEEMQDQESHFTHQIDKQARQGE
jgi:hypothetical protein